MLEVERWAELRREHFVRGDEAAAEEPTGETTDEAAAEEPTGETTDEAAAEEPTELSG